MNNVYFEFAKLNDVEDIMFFMSEHWKKNHIYSRSRILLLRDFVNTNNPEQLNIGLARSTDSKILGVFCFVLTNKTDMPDMFGSLWKVTDEAEKKIPMLGTSLRDFVIKNTKHHFFSAPGPALHTKVIYKMLRLQWQTMKQYYIVNPNLKKYQLISLSGKQTIIQVNSGSIIDLKLVKNKNELTNFDFDKISNIFPFKDKSYVLNRFFNYPFFKYDIYLVYLKGEILAKNIVVCRRAYVKNKDNQVIASAYRIVDFYGTEDLMTPIISELFRKVKKQRDEFLDFVCHGFNDRLLLNAGMMRLNFDDTATIIPNYFEPFIKSNIPIYCIANNVSFNYRQCKADGDQDRPNGK